MLPIKGPDNNTVENGDGLNIKFWLEKARLFK